MPQQMPCISRTSQSSLDQTLSSAVHKSAQDPQGVLAIVMDTAAAKSLQSCLMIKMGESSLFPIWKLGRQ